MMKDDYYDLGDFRRDVTTTSPQAQLWFDRGLAWAYCFNPEEAVRCFEKALDYDPDCAMAHWGVAFGTGPNYNKAWRLFDAEDMQKAVTIGRGALERAREAVARNGTAFEKALIAALGPRFPEQATRDPEEFDRLNRAYADAMRVFYQQFSDDIDAAALFGDALICLSPRALWDLDTGEPIGPGTLEARAVIEDALPRPGGDRHPVLNHLYIHLMEMSPWPEIALPAADRLRRLSRDGAHLAHMSTHIDNACGDWRRVIDSNLDAVEADERYFGHETEVGAWYNVYRVHNLMVGAYGAMMAGRSREALFMANRLKEVLTPQLLGIQSPPMGDLLEAHGTTLPHVLIRFGRWQDILDLEFPTDRELYCSTTAMIHYARGIAFAALRRVPEAEAEREKFIDAVAAVPDSRFNSIPVPELQALAIARKMLDGELEYRKGNIEEAFSLLREAIALEDTLPYSDPPAWLQPVRHAYCALLTEQGRHAEAAEQHRIDLGLERKLGRRRIRPNNVWSLHGLYECLTKLGRHDEAREIVLQRDIAVASADIKIAAACFCRLSAFENEAD